MIHGIHVTLSCYGHWQPNDPRGSGSRYVGSKKLYAVGGKATKTETRHSVAHAPHDVCLRWQIKQALKYPPILFSEQQTEMVGTAFGLLLKEKHVTVFACAVVSDHVHLLLGRTDIHVDDLVLMLKDTAVTALLRNGLHPRSALENYPESVTVAASVWAVGYWKVFIDNSEHMHAAIRYINNHCPAQRWGFVTEYR